MNISIIATIVQSYRPRNAQLPYLPQHLLDLAVEMPLRILLPRVGIEELLHLRHPRIRLGAEAQLDLHQGLEAGVEVRHAQIDELRQLREELLVESFVGGAGEIGFPFRAGKFRGVLVGFLHQLLDAGTGGVVIEELVVAFFDACCQSIDVSRCGGMPLSEAGRVKGGKRTNIR